MSYHGLSLNASILRFIMARYEREPSVLIIGAGTFGTSTAYHLARKYNDPSRVTIVDRTPSPPDHAASTDINKILRADYSSPFYCHLAYEALFAWATWPELHPFYHRTGWIMLDQEGSELSERIREVFRQRGHDPTQDVSLDQVTKKWKGILDGTNLNGFQKAYWNPEAGWCESGAATASLLNAALRYGVQYVTADIKELKVRDGKVECVQTADGRSLSADQIVMATGAWTSSLLSPVEDALDIAEEDRVERQCQAAGVAVAHYKMSDEEMDQLSEMPVVVYGEHGEVIPPPSNRLLKFTNSYTFTNTVTTKSGHRISVPPHRDQRIISDRLKRETESVMPSKVMPRFSRDKHSEYWRLCWDSRTPTQDWVLCQHPNSHLNNLYLAVGGSFHSYKFMPIIGQYMRNVLKGESNGEEMDKAWAWKKGQVSWRGAHESTAPKRELKDIEDDHSSATPKL